MLGLKYIHRKIPPDAQGLPYFTKINDRCTLIHYVCDRCNKEVKYAGNYKHEYKKHQDLFAGHIASISKFQLYKH